MHKEFDHYIFIDYSENLLGYMIIENSKLKSLLPHISRLRHYREAGDKKMYIKNVKITFRREKLLTYFKRYKIRESRKNIEIFLDIEEFLKKNKNCLVFVSVDNNQYANFERLVDIVDGKNTTIVRESELKTGTPEHRVSLVLDNWLNIERLTKDKT